MVFGWIFELYRKIFSAKFGDLFFLVIKTFYWHQFFMVRSRPTFLGEYSNIFFSSSSQYLYCFEDQE
jgi:hypothetical protein